MEATMEHENPKRPSVKVENSEWTRYFIDPRPLPCSSQPITTIKNRRDELVRKVRCLIQEHIGDKNLLHGMKTVDALERLGIGYHFEQEIATFMDLLSSKLVRGDDLSTVALQFRLLRQHHYNVTCEVFKNFMDENGDFKDILRSNVDALLSLYEAAHLGKCDEELLSRAIVFTTDSMSSLENGGQVRKPVHQKVKHALSSPMQRRMKRLEAKFYISMYENDVESNKVILELAKLDFHILQQMHREEVKSMSLWYKDLNPGGTLGGYIRERPVECYFWALCIFSEPHYAKARMMFAKLIKILSLFDDTYDSYGTLDELRLFNQAIQSWDVEGAKQIGNCYACVMSHLSETLDEFVTQFGASPVGIDCTKKIFKEANTCWLQEVVWREEGQVPSLHDYLKVSAITTCCWLLACISFVGMDASDDVFTWVLTFPKIIESATIACRLMDDISGHECEKERSKCATAVDCYVREYSVTVQQAKQALSCLKDEHWRIINQEFLSNKMVPTPLLMRVINLVRMMETAYKNVDGYTHSEEIAVPIHKLLNECVQH